MNNDMANIRNASPAIQSGGAKAAAADAISGTLASEAGQLKRKLERGIINTGELMGFLARVELSVQKKTKRRDLSRTLEYLLNQ